ncbi:hypothetical protein [Halomarina pelagica]|uniref:hypothetical protein n=1 Tax=Halomarina pelagica TaxID=2961599 RepID=UPI0020C1F897|nr:hypothetical protein [Halomarina sp. BND7]
MKPGAGDDPFADDADAERPNAEGADGREGAEPDESSEPSTASPVDKPSTTIPSSDDRPESETAPAASPGTDGSPTVAELDIPWVLRRSSVKSDRDNVHQFFLRDDTARGERELRSEVERLLGKEVSKLDLREAAYLVAMDHPEEVAATLRSWGYDYLE